MNIPPGCKVVVEGLGMVMLQVKETGQFFSFSSFFKTVWYFHIISIHYKQLITREELPETKQVV